MKTKLSLQHLILLCCFILSSISGIAQVKNDFDVRYQNNLRGDLTFIANNIVNRDSSYRDPEDPYNVTGSSSSYNDNLNMQYIDIDSDGSTFSSSSATLTVPDVSCARIRYVGLYWSAVYVNNDRSAIDDIKFRMPGGSYVDITADEILFDGDGDSDFGYYSPYACYKDVTSMVTSLANPNGDYFVANVNASSGSSISGGVSGGWTMVVVYENPNLPGKFITTFDGYAGIKSGETVDIPVNGFTTLPAPFPVNVKLGVSTLEGDNRISGDGLSIRANSSAVFTPLGNAVNPVNNFFNSNITIDGAIINTRNPNSVNTLGWDADLFTINNPLNSVIPNGETGATLRASSSQDKYDIFFTSFDVEVIEPIMNLVKTVEDIAGNDIGGAGINLGDYLEYVLTFQNVGNDNALNYTIRDVLPSNVNLFDSNPGTPEIDIDVSALPPGVTYTYDPATHEVQFNIPDNLVEEGDQPYEIRMRVQVVENCNDLRDACSNIVENLAYSTYRGELNDNQITDDPSYSDFDNCGFGTPGTTNFLVDLGDCDFTRTETLCGDSVLLTAGNGFTTYEWRDENGNIVSTEQTYLATAPGTYVVSKTAPAPCLAFDETVIVEYFGNTQTNPLLAFADEVVTCPNDGDDLPKIFLCGLNDSRLIQTGITDYQEIRWELLDETSCPPIGLDDCANKNSTCDWNTVATGPDFDVSDEGQYRLVIEYQNGCFTRFYFNVFKNPLDPQAQLTDIICASDGEILITNVPNSGYEFQLLDNDDNVVTAWQGSNSFPITTDGIYKVQIRQTILGGAGCLFELDNLGIRERNFDVNVVPTDESCDEQGSIRLQALDVEPQYYFEVSLGGTVLDTHGPTADSDYTFAGLNPGTYDVRVTTDDGCLFTDSVTINPSPVIEAVGVVSRDITSCGNGEITITGTNGVGPYSYSDDNGATFNPNGGVFEVAAPGTYTFLVVDSRNCTDTVDVTINAVPDPVYTVASTDITCNGNDDGTISINVTNSNGFALDYSIDGTNYQTSNTFTGLSANTYTVSVRLNGDDTCQLTSNITINEPNAIVPGTINLVQDYRCDNASATIQATGYSGGTPGYEFSIDGVNFQPTDTFNTGITAGTYSITIRDSEGCTAVTPPITINPLNQPTDISFSATTPNCPALTADVTLTVTDGNPPFTYEIIAPAAVNNGNNNVFTGLAPGTYTFQVTDDKGCTYQEAYTIQDVTPIDVLGQLVSNVTCVGDSDGEISYAVGGFNNTYSYTVAGPTAIPAGNNVSAATLNFNNLAAGDYIITVTDDDTNCTDTATVTVQEPAAALVISTLDVTDLSCSASGTNPGSVVITASGGWGSYEYELEDPTGGLTGPQSNNTFAGLTDTSGNYTVTVRDAGGCEVTQTFSLTPAIAPELTITPNDTCYDDAIGLTLTATVNAGTGTAPFTYTLNGGASNTTGVFTGLSAGTYTIEVTDDKNCTDTETITINPELQVTATAGILAVCETDMDVNITAAGGDGNYVYAIVADGVTPTAGDFSATNPITVTGAGDYDVYVRDNAGNASFCEASFDITITQDAPIVITESHTDVSCNGGTDGSITLSAAGGAGNYTYSIDAGTNFFTSGNFSNLAAGTYNVVVRDASNCDETTTITINEPAALSATASATDYTCAAESQITIDNVTGGSGTYQYSIAGQTGWLPAGGTAATTFTFTPTFTDGTYTVRVRDFNATTCSFDVPVTINPLPAEPALSTAIAYNCDGSGNLTVTAVPGGTYEYQLEDNAGTPIAGYDYATQGNNNVFANVPVGNYIIRVNYGAGNAALGTTCTTTIAANVAAGFEFRAAVTASTDVSCNGGADGSITFEVENFGVGGFEYDINGGGFVNSSTTSPETITGLTAGVYTITVRDVDNPIAGCTVVLNRTIAEPTPVSVTATLDAPLTCDTGATITASASGGTPSYQYQLEDSNGIVAGFDFATNGNNTSFINLPAETYNVRVRDANGCEALTGTPITVVTYNAVTFTVTPTVCYSGSNDATIQVDITDGNNNYEVSLNGGPFVPVNTTATQHLFSGLSDGTYTIDVRDGYGCNALQQSVTINPTIVATTAVVDITSCANGSITVTASGGDGNLQYAFVPTGNPVTPGDFGATNTFTVTNGNQGDYDVYVRDNNATAPFCEYTETVTVNGPTPLTFTATPIDPECHDGMGQIDITVTSGISPYTYEIIDLDNGGAANETNTNVINNTKTYFNLAPGDYTINVTDATGCLVQQTPVTINNPDELTADILPILPPNCDPDPNLYGFEFDNYPTTLAGTLEFSADGGATWQASDTFTGLAFASGTNVFPSIRTVDGLGNTLCITHLPRFTIPYPLDDLDITISTIVVNCNELQVTVQGTQGVAPYEYAYTDNPATFNPLTAAWTAPIPGAHTWTGLIPGRTYVFYVRDATNCLRQSNVNVNDITVNPIEISAVSEPSCFGASDGEITYTLIDNQAPTGPNMRWELFDLNTGAIVRSSGNGVTPALPGVNIAYTGTINVTGLAAGEYYIVVTEVDGGGVDACVSGSENLILEELDPITGTPNALRDITCDTPGLIEIPDIAGGGGIYTYTLTSSDFSASITSVTDNPIEVPISQVVTPNPASIIVNVDVEDQYGCSQSLGAVTLNISQAPTIDSINIDNCTVPSTVTINATSSGGAAIFYSIDGGANYYNNGGVFTNVAEGTYNISIIDDNGCTDTDTFTVHPALSADVSLTKLLDCSASPDAQITIDILSGSGDNLGFAGSYDYQIDNGLGPVVARTALPTNPFTANVTVAETYTITIYDNNTAAPECNRVFTVEVPAAITPVFTETHQDITCNGANDGTITLTETSNGVNPLTYTISPAAGTFNAATNTFENLPPGTYTVTGTGTNGCTFDISNIPINEPAIINIPTVTVNEFDCTGDNNRNNALITVDDTAITGGSGNYVIYEFVNPSSAVVQSGASTSYTVTNPAGGVYTINVYDDNGCVGTTTATVAPYVELTGITTTPTNPTCVPGADGEVQVDITFNPGIGTNNVQYDIVGLDVVHNDTFTGNVDTYTFTGLGIGNYQVTATNTTTGCLLQTTVELTDPNTFTINTNIISDVVCFGTNTGAVTFSITDATYTGGFDYQVFEQVTNNPVTAVANHVNLGPTPIVNLPAGDFYVVITQDGAPECTNQQNFSIAGPDAALAATAAVTPITCNGGDGIIEITASEGWGGYSYYVSTTANPDPNNPANYSANASFTNLAPGTYEIWVMDQGGCAIQLPNEVLADPTPITANIQVNQFNCNGTDGEIQVTGTAGGQGSNYTYQLIVNGTPTSNTNTTGIFSNLGAGTYEVLVSDQWNCTFTTAAVVFYEEMNAVAEVTQRITCDPVSPEGIITVTTTGGSGNFQYDVATPISATPLTNGTGVFNNLTEAGVYNFTITDLDTGCTTTAQIELTNPISPIIDTITPQDVSCNGGSDGSVVITLDNTTEVDPPYTYTITAGPLTPPANTTGIFTGLPAGNYTFTVESAISCSVTDTFTIGEPLALDANVTNLVQLACNPSNGVQAAEIEVTITAGTGTPNYSYSVNGGAFIPTGGTVFTYTTTAAGNYDIVVRDDNGCTVTLPTQTIDPLPVMTLSMAVNNAITCANGEEITVTANGQSTPTDLTFTVLETGDTQTVAVDNATFTLPSPGDYTIQVTDNGTGCYEIISHTVNPYNFIEVTAAATTPVTCFGDSNGALEINVTGYTGNYTYEVFDSAGTSIIPATAADTSVNPRPITGLAGGNYYVEVVATDAPFCPAISNIITIISPDRPLTVTLTETANVTCNNDAGEIIAIADGGWGTYEYELIHTTSGTTVQNYDTNNIFTGLTAGDYEVNVRDLNGCIATNTITLIEPTPINADITASLAMLACYGDENASVSAINVTGGQGAPNYRYSLNVYDATGTTIEYTTASQASDTFNNLGSGTYSITVSDNWSCDFTTATVTITDPTEIAATLAQVSNPNCAGEADLEITATGVAGPFEYSVDGVTYTGSFASSITLSMQPSGTYQFYVREIGGSCEPTITNRVTIDPTPALQLQLDLSGAFVNCFGDNSAVILADATGGLGNYTYEIYDVDPTSVGATALATNTDGEFNGYAAGTYYVQVLSGDCPPVYQQVVVDEPEDISITSSFTNPTCPGENNGTITVDATGGRGPILYAIATPSDPNFLEISEKNVFEDLAPGNYQVLVQDQLGCRPTVLDFTIVDPAPINVSLVNKQDVVCYGDSDGSIEINVTGGVSGAGPYWTSLNSQDDANFVQDQFVFNNLEAGTYVIFVRDANGCQTNYIETIEAGVTINPQATVEYGCNDNIPFNRVDVSVDASVINDVMYALNPSDPNDLSQYQIDPFFNDVPGGNHTIYVAHSNGCIAQTDVAVDATTGVLTLTLAQGNINEIVATAQGGYGDYTYYFNDVNNGNDNTYYINQSGIYTVTVIDREGCEVSAQIEMEFIDIEIPNYFTPDGDTTNDTWYPRNREAFPNLVAKVFDRYGRLVAELRGSKEWDGTYDGKELPSGDYWYVIKLNGENDPREFVGNVTLYR